MKIFVSQVYVEVGVAYPFSHHFQIWLGQELTKRVQPSPWFVETYTIEFDLIFRVSAKSRIPEPEIRGPTVFRQDKNVEFSVFLPHDGREATGPTGYRRPLKFLFDSIATVLQRLGMDASRVVGDSSALIEHVISRPAMIIHRRPIAPLE